MEKTNYPRLRELRLENELKQIEVGEVLGVAQRTYSDYETGRLDLPTRSLIKLADYYGVTTDYILEHETKDKERGSTESGC